MNQPSTAARDHLAVERAAFLLSLQLEQATARPTPYRSADPTRSDSRYGEPVTPEQADQHAAVLLRESAEWDRTHRGEDRMHLTVVA